jgi:O-antigen/teichoic acid export membrane protein
MFSHDWTLIIFNLAIGSGISAVVLSIIILRRGKLYRRLSPGARPRRWILISLLILFAVFVVWFPVWITWPDALFSRLLTGLFGLTFFVVGMTIKWLAPLVDAYVKRRGWHLR